jgi:hypothetical protein
MAGEMVGNIGHCFGAQYEIASRSMLRRVDSKAL